MSKRLIHWSGAQPGQCPRKDSGADQAPPVQAGGGSVQYMGVADHPGNVTCPVCRKLANRT